MSFNEPLVSIIIPLYNCELYIEETVQSVLSQSYSNWELLVIDDGSTDSSLNILEKYLENSKKIKIFKRDGGLKGGSVCRNIGIRHALGEYIIFLDADDLLHRDCVDKRVQAVLTDQTLDFAVFKTKVFYSIIGDSHLYAMNTDEIDPLMGFICNKYPYPWHTSSPIWKASFLKSFGGFSESYQRLQDPEFHTRVLLKNCIKYKLFYNVPEDSYYRVFRGRRSNKNLEIKYIDGMKLFLNDLSPLILNFDNDNKTKYFKYLKQALWNCSKATSTNVKFIAEYFDLLINSRRLKITNNFEIATLILYYVSKSILYKTFKRA